MFVNRKRRFFVLAAALLAVMLAWILWQFRPPPVPPSLPPGYEADRAVWLSIDWVMMEHSDTQVSALACELYQHKVSFGFTYVSYLKPGDFFNPTFDFANEFTERLHQYLPNLHILAWIGVPVQATSASGEHSENRLANPSIREMIADFSAEMVADYAFDGVHVNAELVSDGDEAFLATLQAIRHRLPPGAFLSTTAHALRLTERVTTLPYPTLRHHWSASYLRLVGEHSDQVALMAYDSGLPLPGDYRTWIAYQVKSSATALAGTQTMLFIGVPTSEEWTPSHQTASEYLTNALTGVRFGLAESLQPQIIRGLAIYPHWEMDSAEWKALDNFFPITGQARIHSETCSE